MSELSDERRLLSLKEVAEVLGTSDRQVSQWFREGTLPSLPVGAGREPKINLVMLDAWLRHRATAPATRGGRK